MDKAYHLSKERVIHEFADIEGFYDMLQDRLYVALRRFNFVSFKHTSWIIALPRERSEEVKDIPDLIYAGINKQKKMLDPQQSAKELDPCWEFLEKNKFNLPKNPNTVSSNIVEAINTKQLSLEDIPKFSTDNLKTYFKPIEKHDPGKPLPDNLQRRKNEYHILKHYFPDLNTHFFLSVPLIAFGEVDGIIHIVLHETDLKKFRKIHPDGSIEWRIQMIGNIIKLFSWEYEALILDWDVVGPNKYTSSLIPYVIAQLNELLSPKFWEDSSPIFRDLEYDTYYRENAWHYYERYKQNFDVTQTIYDQQLKNAITSILVDSYAHNVSAHSLTALSWWFRKRALWRSTSGKTHLKGFVKSDIESLLDFATRPMPELKDPNILKRAREYAGEIAKELLNIYFPGELQDSENNVPTESEDNSVIGYKGSLAREIQPLIGFLAEKGAFWSGVTRDENFGGEVKDLFSVLWYDFINNPLYLGTIAKTEDITHIRLKVIVYEPKATRHANGILEKKVKVQGEFAYLNILTPPAPTDPYEEDGSNKVFYVEIPETKERLKYSEYGRNTEKNPNFAELQDRSRYVNPGEGYSRLRNVLQKYFVFFPGGVVGRHAFFTIIENEIRNIKHYFGQDLLNAQKNGLVLALSVRPCSLREDVPSEEELYQIGVWLEIPTKLSQIVRADESPYLIRRKHLSLYQSIMHPSSYTPFLGGNYQDKVCAAMLFNNTFSSVQKGDDDPRRLGYVPYKSEDELTIPQDDALPEIEVVRDSARDKRFYPWIGIASSLKETAHNDYELTGKPIPDKDAFVRQYPHGDKNALGYTKKFFYLWKGSDIKEISGANNDWEWENSSRFRIVEIGAAHWEDQWIKARSGAGVIRIVTKAEQLFHSEQERFHEAYRRWLHHWLGRKTFFLSFVEKSRDGFNDLFGIYYDGKGETAALQYTTKPPVETENQTVIKFAHKGTSSDDSIFRFRSHGIYKQYFGDPNLNKASIQYELRMMEFLETWATKICIFDNRIRHRIRDDEHYRQIFKQINISVNNESIEDWDSTESASNEAPVKEYIKDCNFLVMHLTFIDSILRVKYSEKRYEEESRLGIFIEHEIMPLILDSNGNRRNNFIFVVTTGRGRKDWWDYLKKSKTYKEFTKFTLFRPVESIISGIESAVGKEDDIELKYNLVKVMFGS